MFTVKTLAVLFPPYPREMKINTRNLNLPPFCRLLVFMEMVQPILTRVLSRVRGLSMRTHLTAEGFLCGRLDADHQRYQSHLLSSIKGTTSTPFLFYGAEGALTAIDKV